MNPHKSKVRNTIVIPKAIPTNLFRENKIIINEQDTRFDFSD